MLRGLLLSELCLARLPFRTKRFSFVTWPSQERHSLTKVSLAVQHDGKRGIASPPFNRQRPHFLQKDLEYFLSNLPQQAQLWLVRDWIHYRLYDSVTGYFNKPQRIGLARFNPIDFNSLKGQEDYFVWQRKLYEQSLQGWLTPTELFQPYYGHGVLNWIMSTSSYQRLLKRFEQHGDAKLKIFECGGGNGTLAASLLDKLREDHPEIYHRTEYTLIDISLELAKKQQQTMEECGHGAVSQVVNMSAIDWQTPVEDECFVLGFELLDNMPHDKIQVRGGKYLETYVLYDPEAALSTGEQQWSEVEIPVQDPLICKALNAIIFGGALRRYDTDPSSYSTVAEKAGALLRWVLSYFEGAINVDYFLPTVALRWLEVLAKYFPRHNLLIADFNRLPDSLYGWNAPVVQGKEPNPSQGGNVLHNYPHYIQPNKDVDIFFPIDFAYLAKMYALICQRDSNYRLHSEFTKLHFPIEKLQTKSGYNPALSDYKNAACFFAEYEANEFQQIKE